MITNTYAIFVDGTEYNCTQLSDGTIRITNSFSNREIGIFDSTIPQIGEDATAFEDNVSKFIKNSLDGWELIDASCNQYRKEIVEDEIYLFREDRIINPQTKETETFESEMNYNDYNWHEIVAACESFGYTAKQVDKWITAGDEIPLMLECLFELEN